MAVIVYRSTDASAPVLTGQTNSLVALLDAVLINGYGAGPQATPAGWSIAFTATNKRSYRQGAGNQYYFDVVDDASTTAQSASIRGYETMSAITTGTNLFPTTGQVGSPGLWIRKSGTADATARPWIIAADSKTCHIFINSGETAGAMYVFSFGEFFSLGTTTHAASADPGRCHILCNASSGNQNQWGVLSDNSNQTGHYIARNSAETVGAVNHSKFAVPGGNGNVWTNQAGLGPMLDSNYYVFPMWMSDVGTARVPRGRVRGIYQVIGGVDGDTFDGAGDLAGKSFQVITTTSSVALALETSNTWDSN